MLAVSIPIPTMTRWFTKNETASAENPGKWRVVESWGVRLPIRLGHKFETSWGIQIYVLIFLIGVSGCVSSHHSPGTLVDLTYPFDEHTIYWPNNEPFHWEKSSWGHTHQGYWYASGVFSASEHGGTHLDAPIHFAEFGWSVDEIPLTHLTAEAVVLDIRSQANSNPDYMLRVEDIAQWERQHGAIPRDSIVFLLTGWGQYWPNPSRYLGSPTRLCPLSRECG